MSTPLQWMFKDLITCATCGREFPHCPGPWDAPEVCEDCRIEALERAQAEDEADMTVPSE